MHYHTTSILNFYSNSRFDWTLDPIKRERLQQYPKALALTELDFWCPMIHFSIALFWGGSTLILAFCEAAPIDKNYWKHVVGVGWMYKITSFSPDSFDIINSTSRTRIAFHWGISVFEHSYEFTLIQRGIRVWIRVWFRIKSESDSESDSESESESESENFRAKCDMNRLNQVFMSNFCNLSEFELLWVHQVWTKRTARRQTVEGRNVY